MRVRLFGPVALVHGVFVVADGAGKVAKVRYTDVHLWNATVWQLVSVQNTLLKGSVAVLRKGLAAAQPRWQGQNPVGDARPCCMR